MKLSSILISTSMVTVLFTSAPAPAQEEQHSFIHQASLYSKNIWQTLSRNSQTAPENTPNNNKHNHQNNALQGSAHYASENGFYASTLAAQYPVFSHPYEMQRELSSAYTFTSTNQLVDIDFAVTNYQFTGKAISSAAPKVKMHLAYDIAAINSLRDIDVKTTYFEVSVNHKLNEYVSVGTHVGMNDAGQHQFYDYALNANYALNKSVLLTLGYSHQALDTSVTASKLYGGASLRF